MGKTYHLGEFYSCSPEFVIYCLTCPCGLLYVGRTVQTLRKRFGEHRRSIEEGAELTIPRHFKEFHQGSTKGLQVWVLESIPKSLPRAECTKCERETFWIYTLDSLSPGGLNEEIEIHTIL